MKTLSEYAQDRNNNFNLIRFILATLVIFSHCYGILGFIEPITNLTGNMSFGSFAVDAFFVISGFLVSSSLIMGNGNLINFFYARILRVYPALIVSVLFTVFVIGTNYTTLSLVDFLIHTDIYIYIIKNATFLFSLSPEYYLPGVFESKYNHDTVINASLWSLPWEIRLYMLLGVLFFIFRNVLSTVIIIITIFSLMLYLINHVFSFTGNNLQSFIRVFTLFFLGASFFFFKHKIIINYDKKSILFIIFIPLLIMLFMLLVLDNKPLFFIFYNLIVGYFIFYFAYFPNRILRKFNEVGDYSYGLYIYSFPIQQAICVSFPKMNLMLFFIASYLTTLICAILSWHLIEKPCLKMKKR